MRLFVGRDSIYIPPGALTRGIAGRVGFAFDVIVA
jgi:hypothetical protein